MLCCILVLKIRIYLFLFHRKHIFVNEPTINKPSKNTKQLKTEKLLANIFITTLKTKNIAI